MLIAVIRPASTRNVASMCWLWAPGRTTRRSASQVLPVSRISPGIMRRPFSPRRNQPPTRSTPRSVWTLSPTCTRISVFSSISATAASRSPAFSFSKKSSIVSTAPIRGVYRRPPMDARLETAWPLFGLRLRTEHLVLRMPTDDDLTELLQVAKAGIHPPGEMPFGVAWTSLKGASFDRGFMQHYWGTRATFSPENWFLNLMVELDGRPIGAQSVNAEGFPTFRTVHTGSWLGREYQGRGLGKEMRAAVLGFAFDGLGAHVATTGAFLDNGPSTGVSRALGYEEDG